MIINSQNVTTRPQPMLLVPPKPRDDGEAKPKSCKLLSGTRLGDAPDCRHEYTFPAAAGQSIGAILTEVTTTPAAPSIDPLTMQVIGPSGAVVRTCNLGSTYNASCRFPVFSTGGTYKLLIKAGPNAASFRLQLRTTI